MHHGVPDEYWRYVVGLLTLKLRNNWICGYENHLDSWRSLDEATRRRIEAVIATWCRSYPLKKGLLNFPTECLAIQVLNLVGRKGMSIDEWLSAAEREELAFGPNGDPVHVKERTPEQAESCERWNNLTFGLGCHDYLRVDKIWRALTPEMRAIVDGVGEAESIGSQAPMDTPEGIAWLAKSGGALREVIAGDDRLRLHLNLTPEAAQAIVATLLDQQAAWAEAGVAKIGGSGTQVDCFVGDLLAQIACFARRLTDDQRKRAAQLGVSRPPGVHRKHDKDPLQAESYEGPLDIPTIERGITLTEYSPGAGHATETGAHAVTAPADHRVDLDDSDYPLVVLLDLDLTRPELSFLGLEGTRLVICDQEGSRVCYTRVDLRGGVSRYEDNRRLGELIGPRRDPVQYDLVSDRPTLSPYEGMIEAGKTGRFARMGGYPAWLQDPDPPNSPESDRAMTFIAQLRHPGGGSAYVFLDYDNLIVAVTTQRD